MAYPTREIRIAGGTERPYDPDEWRGELVTVKRGVLELVSRAGVRLKFGPGSVLFLTGLSLRSLRNPGGGTAFLTAVKRGPVRGPRDLQRSTPLRSRPSARYA